MTNFYTSDLHIFHEKILDYCDRPFRTTEKMWRAIKKNWNSVVGKDDTVWIAGDLTLKKESYKPILTKMLEELKGTKHLIIGNHDLMTPINYIDIGISSVHYPATQLPNGWFIGHDPSLANVFPKGSVYLCGHQHGNLFDQKVSKNGVLVIDVGVDVRNFTPLSSLEIAIIIKDKSWLNPLMNSSLKEQYGPTNKKDR